MTDDFGRNPLPNLALSLWIDRQDKIRMGFDVDEARCYGEPFGLNDLFCFVCNCGFKRRDPTASDRNIANDTWPATPVDDEPTANQQIPAHTIPPASGAVIDRFSANMRVV
jgi:hypothetical protein